MARTIEEIEQVILDAKTAEAGLNGLTSSSKMAIWRLWVKITARVHWILEALIDLKLKELDSLGDSIIPGNELWYYNKLKEFQYGYELIVQDGQLVYLVEDTEAMIIAQVAVRSVDGALYIKACKDNAGTYEKLTAAEIIAFESYINAIKFAGTKHLLISTDPDQVYLDLTIYYDGKLDLTEFKAATEATIEGYLADVGYDGIFRVNRLRDDLEAQTGVKDTLFDVVKIKPSGGSYLDIEVEYDPISGYYEIDPTFPLSNLKYIPK